MLAVVLPKRWIRNLALTFLAFAMIAAMLPGLLLVPVTLLFGWMNALRRIIGTLAASSGALVWAGAAVLLIVAGTPLFCSWYWQS